MKAPKLGPESIQKARVVRVEVAAKIRIVVRLVIRLGLVI